MGSRDSSSAARDLREFLAALDADSIQNSQSATISVQSLASAYKAFAE